MPGKLYMFMSHQKAGEITT